MIIDFDEAAYAPEPTTLPITDAFREVPVCLRIADTELLVLGWDEAEDDQRYDQLPLAITDIARWGFVAVQQAKRHGYADFDLGEYGEMLAFKLVGETILIRSTIREKTVAINYAALEASWLAFSERVRVFLIRRFAGLQREHAWAGWLRGEPDPVPELFPGAAEWFQARAAWFEHVDARES